MYWESKIHYIHKIYITVSVGPPTVKKFNPQLFFLQFRHCPGYKQLVYRLSVQKIKS